MYLHGDNVQNYFTPKNIYHRILCHQVYIRLSIFSVVPIYACTKVSFFILGLCTEGLYRVSGNKTDQDNIQKQFDQGKKIII